MNRLAFTGMEWFESAVAFQPALTFIVASEKNDAGRFLGQILSGPAGFFEGLDAGFDFRADK